MYINSNYYKKIYNIHPLESMRKTTPKLQTLEKDTFEKSKVNVSFCALVYNQIDLEHQTQTCVDAIEDNIKIIDANKAKKAMKLNTLFKSEYSGAINLFAENNITNVGQLTNFVKSFRKYSHQHEVFEDNYVEAIKIFSLLDNKKDFEQYPELLLAIYMRNKAMGNSDFSILNACCEFFKLINLESDKKFDEKFPHLKSLYNNFSTPSDKLNAILHITSRYDDKMAFINANLSEATKKTTYAEELYSENIEIIDYLYDENQNGETRDYTSVFDVMSKSAKLKHKSKEQFAQYFNNYETVQDILAFYEFLAETQTDINDFNKLTKTEFIEESDILEHILNKQAIVEHLNNLDCFGQKANSKRNIFSSANTFYTTFKDALNALYNADKNGFTNIDILVNIINGNPQINSQSDLMNLYNAVYKVKRNKMSTDDFNNFIELLKYLPYETNLLEKAKKENQTPLKLLENAKAEYKKLESDIEDYLLEDESLYFAGKSAFDVYKEHYDLITSDSKDVRDILKGIADFNALNNSEYKEHLDDLNRFSVYFQNKKELLRFLSDNQIKLTNAPKDKAYKDSCYEVLTLISKESNKNKRQERIDYFAKSKFLLNSKYQLSEFINKFSTESEKREIFEIIADRKINSLADLQKFLNTYKDKNNSTRNAISHLKSLPPEIDFESDKKILSTLTKRINALNINLFINGNNIQNIDINKFKSIEHKSLQTDDLCSLLNELLGKRRANTNFLINMETSTTEAKKYSRVEIAEEIAKRYYEYEKSYKNLKEIFGLDENSLALDDNERTYYILTKKIEEKLPQDFVDFVNSNDWCNITEDEKKAINSTLHAKLRIIDRFILNKYGRETYNSDEAKQYAKSLLKTIYSDIPITIKAGKLNNTFYQLTNFDGYTIKSIFDSNGTMITATPT